MAAVTTSESSTLSWSSLQVNRGKGITIRQRAIFAERVAKEVAWVKRKERCETKVAELKDRSGSSKVAILRYLTQNYQLGDNASKINTNIRLALKKGVERGELKQVTGSGANGSFKLGEKKGAAPKVKKPIVKKAKEVKPAAPKKERKAADPKKSERTSKTPKKVASKTSKKADSPAPKASKPKSARPAAKNTTTKSA